MINHAMNVIKQNVDFLSLDQVLVGSGINHCIHSQRLCNGIGHKDAQRFVKRYWWAVAISEGNIASPIVSYCLHILMGRHVYYVNGLSEGETTEPFDA